MKQDIHTNKRYTLDPKQSARFLAEVSPCGGGEMPAQVVGWSRKGLWKRMKATYPNGWELIVYFDRAERVSSWTAKMSLRVSGWLPGQRRQAGSTKADSDGDDGA